RASNRPTPLRVSDRTASREAFTEPNHATGAALHPMKTVSVESVSTTVVGFSWFLTPGRRRLLRCHGLFRAGYIPVATRSCGGVVFTCPASVGPPRRHLFAQQLDDEEAEGTSDNHRRYERRQYVDQSRGEH